MKIKALLAPKLEVEEDGVAPLIEMALENVRHYNERLDYKEGG